MAYRNFTLDITPGGIPIIIPVSQNTEELIQLDLIASGGEDIPAYQYIRGTKLKDMTGFEYQLINSPAPPSGSKYFQLTKQMTAVAGKVVCELSTQTYDSTNRTYSSANFFLIVEPAAMSDETLQSATDVRDLMSRMNAIAEDVEADADRAEAASGSASNYALLSRSYAKGDTNSREGESTDNASYYMTQARSANSSANTHRQMASYYANTANSLAGDASRSANSARASAAEARQAKEWVEQWYENLVDAANTNY